MMKNHWILPQGIEEALPDAAARMERLRRDLLDLYQTWGYEQVMPPMIDHIESLLTGTGHDLDLQTFKLVDQISGRTLGVRADMTPQVARIDAHQLKREAPTRLCYIGTVLHTRPETIGESRSPMQVGAELYGHAGVESEVEILCLMLQTFDRVGVRDVYLDLGNVDVFRSLSQRAGLSADVESRLFEMMQRKAVTEIAALLDSLHLSADDRAMLQALPSLNGDIEILSEARRVLSAAGEAVLRGIDYLEETARRLRQRDADVKMHFDLSELHGYHYKTGVVFAAFVPQSGRAIARGGRYDDIGRLFGRARAATGFSTDLKTLIGLGDVAPQVASGVFAPLPQEATGTSLAEAIASLRNDGVKVIEALPGQAGGAAEMGCDRVLAYVDGRWVVKPL